MGHPDHPKVVFDENARKEFLTGFRKRKDERRKQWKEKIDRQLKNEIKKIKNDTKSKVVGDKTIVFQLGMSKYEDNGEDWMAN